MPGKDVKTMNRVILMGRLTKNPEIKYAGKDNDMAVARYTLAVNRKYKRDGEQEADFISCVTFGKSAEFAQKYLHKGMRIVIGGRISTGSYKDKDGKTIYTTDDLKERIDELNGVVSVSKKEISEKRDQLKKLENLQKMAEVIKINQPLIDEYNRFYFQKRREKYYQQHKKEINYYRKCERELKQHLDKNGKVPTARWKREKEELRTAIEELKADKQPYQDELAFVKKVQTCADIARRDREMAEADTSGRSEEKSEKQTKFPAFHAAQTEDIFEESGKAEQQPVNQQEKKPEKKTSLLRKLDEKKKECAERDAKQQAVREKRNHEMSL